LFKGFLQSQLLSALRQIGYQHEGNLGIVGREAFKYEGKSHLQKNHFYVCTQNFAELKGHISFRDYLRLHPEAVREYSRIKEEGPLLYPMIGKSVSVHFKKA
jgi:GrpB-like predicted nucleotidyltransferase (UPF0157 family)